MKTIHIIIKVLFAVLLTLPFSLSTLFAQNDTMYLMKSGAVVGIYNVDTDVDSVIFYRPATTDVINPTTGKIWMDRNLGASQVATSIADTAAYGDLYQWGRAADGHESRTSGTTATLVTSDTPGHGNFILAQIDPWDWRSPQNDSLWQGVNGNNNPCPEGYRLPTEAEWNAERQSWTINNASGAITSPLKLPVAGYRSGSLGSLFDIVSVGYYWSSTVSGTRSRFLYFSHSLSDINSHRRADGYSVRCLRDSP